MQYQLKKSFSDDLLASPLRISYDFQFEIPKSYSKKKREAIAQGEILHTNTPDCSNVVKFFEDTLKGVVIEDDKYVVESIARKSYGNRCQVVIKIDLLS